MPIETLELKGKAPYGKIISVDEAKDSIKHSLEGLEKIVRPFTETFESELDWNKKTLGIYYHAGDEIQLCQAIYLIGSSKSEVNAQISLCVGDVYFSLLGGGPVIYIGLDYQANDVSFQPLTERAFREQNGDKEPKYEIAFPLFFRECGARLIPKNPVKLLTIGTEVSTKLNGIKVLIKDEKLRGLATDLQKRIEQ